MPEWFHTGDLGTLDDDQNLTYVDRVKDSLRRRGENVSSVEVETTVMRHPAVLEAAAVGIPSDLGEDDILVVVTLRPEADRGFHRVARLLLGAHAVLLRAAISGSDRRDPEERDRARPQGRAAQQRSRRERVGPRSSRLRCQSLTENATCTLTYQQQFVLDGLAGRAAILDLDARYNRLYSAGDLAGWIATFRHAGASFTRAARHSPTCALRSTAATVSDWSPSTMRSPSTAWRRPSDVSRCSTGTTSYRPQGHTSTS